LVREVNYTDFPKVKLSAAEGLKVSIMNNPDSGFFGGEDE